MSGIGEMPMAQLALSWRHPQQQSRSKRSVQLRERLVRFAKFFAIRASSALSMNGSAISVRDSRLGSGFGERRGEWIGEGVAIEGRGKMHIFFKRADCVATPAFSKSTTRLFRFARECKKAGVDERVSA
jgi:hypothetical protein